MIAPSWLFPLIIFLIAIMSIIVAIKGVVYCGKHPNGRRRLGAWILSFACSGILVASGKWVAEGMFADQSFMLSILVMLLLILGSSLLLLSHNPAPIVDYEDWVVTMNIIKSGTCEFASQIKQDIKKKDTSHD